MFLFFSSYTAAVIFKLVIVRAQHENCIEYGVLVLVLCWCEQDILQRLIPHCIITESRWYDFIPCEKVADSARTGVRSWWQIGCWWICDQHKCALSFWGGPEWTNLHIVILLDALPHSLHHLMIHISEGVCKSHSGFIMSECSRQITTIFGSNTASFYLSHAEILHQHGASPMEEALAAGVRWLGVHCHELWME